VGFEKENALPKSINHNTRTFLKGATTNSLFCYHQLFATDPYRIPQRAKVSKAYSLKVTMESMHSSSDKPSFCSTRGFLAQNTRRTHVEIDFISRHAKYTFNNNAMKRGTTEIPNTTYSVEKRQKIRASLGEGSSEAVNREKQSQKLVQDFMASLETSGANEEAEEEEKSSSLSNEEKKDRKRKINRLSAQRKRVRERVQLDTLTDRYAQLSYKNEALKGDNGRLNKLISSLKGTLSEAKQQESSASASKQKQQFDRGAYLLEKLGLVEKVRQSLLTSVLEGQPARLNSLDPTTGSAAGSTTENPFVQTTSLLAAKVKVVDRTRQTLITVLHSVQQTQAPLCPGVSGGNMFSTVTSKQAAPKQWPKARENLVSFHSQLLSALRAPASAPAPPPPPSVPTAAAAPNAMVLFQLLAALGGSTGNAHASQVAVANSAQIPNGNVAGNYQGFQGAPSNILQPASVSGAVSACSQPPQASGSAMIRSPPTQRLSLASNSTQPPHAVTTTTKLPPPSVAVSSTTTTSQAPVGGSMNNSQVASLAALLQLLRNRQGQQGLSQGR
jgi:hypothetical protein